MIISENLGGHYGGNHGDPIPTETQETTKEGFAIPYLNEPANLVQIDSQAIVTYMGMLNFESTTITLI